MIKRFSTNNRKFIMRTIMLIAHLIPPYNCQQIFVQIVLSQKNKREGKICQDQKKTTLLFVRSVRSHFLNLYAYVYRPFQLCGITSVTSSRFVNNGFLPVAHFDVRRASTAFAPEILYFLIKYGHVSVTWVSISPH